MAAECGKQNSYTTRDTLPNWRIALRNDTLKDDLSRSCALCALLGNQPVGSVTRLDFEGAEVLAPVTHKEHWAELDSAEQFQLMGQISATFGSLNKRNTTLTTASSGGHFHIRVEKGQVTNSRFSVPSNTLISGGDDPLFEHLKRQIDGAKHIDLAVAFAVDSGVAMLEPYLEDMLARGGHLRLVVGDYFGVTEPSALRRLMDLDGRVERFIYETRGGSFHPKAWVFRASDSKGTAIVGSSNLTRTALKNGVEWNLQSGSEQNDWQPVHEAFEALIRSPNVLPLTQEWIDDYASRREAKPLPEFAQAVAEESPAEPVPEPHDIQRKALQALELTRKTGHRAGLVVLATGLGKTWLSAFDSVDFNRILFVAHREEILTQAMHTFRRIRPEGRFGRFTGQAKEEGDIIFASIQTIGRREHLDRFAPAAFDYIIIDEFHHAAAKSYRDLLDHFTPHFLLGLTATPERTDGGDLLGLCSENLVFQCDLIEGVSSGRLVPFRYFGVPDEVDYEQIPWRSSRFDDEALTAALATAKRAKNALDQYRKHGAGPAIGFCCSRRHANFMADFFMRNGLRAAAVHSGEDSAPRTSSLEALGKGELDILFAVDMFNEGIDVPQIGTVLMLRPTESTIVFLQQLGRGLRRAEGKSHLQVIDYIGNHRSFLTKARALLSAADGDRSLLRKLEDLENGLFALPEGCSVTYELQALDLLKAMLRARGGQNELEAFYHDFKLRHGQRPTASEVARADFNPAGTGHGGWFDFVRDMGDKIPDDLMTTHGDLLRMIGNAKYKSADPLLVLKAALRNLSRGAPLARLHGAFEAFSDRWPEVGEIDDQRFEEGLQHWLMTSHFASDGEMLTLARADQTSLLSDLLGELVDWRLIEFLTIEPQAAVVREEGATWNAGPELWRSYMREDIPPLFDKEFNPGNWNSGIVRVDNDLVLLTTLKKGALSSGNHYEDRFLNPTRMQWQSQNQTRRDSDQGLILSGQKQDAKVYLFVRGEKMRDSRAAPFIYCGQPRFVSWEGEKPITIQWELPSEIPVHLHRVMGLE